MPSCTNGVLDIDETLIDCGGPCRDCPNLTEPFASNFTMPGCTETLYGYVFSLWAPNMEKVELVGSFNNWTGETMNFNESTGYWWIVKPKDEIEVGSNYKYILDEVVWISDPYGKSFNNDENNENSIVVSNDYIWNDSAFIRPPLNQTVILEIPVIDFTRGDACILPEEQGKFKGFFSQEKIDYLLRIGVNAVELMPIQEWAGSGYSWGYNNCGYFAPENSLGTNSNNGSAYNEFKELVDILHQNGIAVILDVVYNHASDDNNYLWEIYADYYFDGRTDWGPRFDWTKPMVQKFFLTNMVYWIEEFHVDGFRFDATEHSEIYSMLGVIEQLINNGYEDIYYIMEEWDPLHNSAIRQFNENHGHIISSWGSPTRLPDCSSDWEYPQRFKEVLWNLLSWGTSPFLGEISYYANNHGCGWQKPINIINYFSSHDEGNLSCSHEHNNGRRAASKREVKTATVHLLTSMGVPMLWLGEDFMRGHCGNNAEIGNGCDDFNNLVDWSLMDEHSDLIDFTSELIKLRIAHPALHSNLSDPYSTGNFNWHTDWNGSFIGYSYVVEGDRNFIVLVNYGDSEKVQLVDFPNTGDWHLMCNGDTATSQDGGLETWNITDRATEITVPAKTGFVLMSNL